MKEKSNPDLNPKERSALNRAAKNVRISRHGSFTKDSEQYQEALQLAKASAMERQASPSGEILGGGGGGGNTSRVPLLFVDPLFDPILLMFPKENIKELNRRLRHYYSYHPYVRNIMDLHATVPLSDFELKCENKEHEKFYNEFKDRVNLLELLTQMNRDYHLLGESFVYGNWDEANSTWKSFNQYPPENVEVHKVYVGPGVAYFLKPDEELRKILNSPKEVDQAVGGLIPPEFRESIKSGKPYLLDTARVIHFARRPSGYSLRGESIVKSILKDLLYEDKLRLLQYTFVDRHMFPIKLWKLGSKEKGWIPSPKHFEKFDQLLAQAANDPDFNIIFHPFIEAEFLTPIGKTEDLLKHFDWVAKRIMAGLFATEAMVGGEANPYANQAVSMKVVMHRYMMQRDSLENLVREKVFLPMAMRRGYFKKDKDGQKTKEYDLPRFFWQKMNIMNNQAELEMLLRLRKDGEIPFEIVADTFGWDPEVLKEAWKREHATELDPVWKESRKKAVEEDPKVRLQVLNGTKTSDLNIIPTEPPPAPAKKGKGRPALAEGEKAPGPTPALVPPSEQGSRDKGQEAGTIPTPLGETSDAAPSV